MTATKEAPYFPNFDYSTWTRCCEKELDAPVDGKITGTIPPWLRGTLLRNSPGTFKLGDMEFGHLFDGPALLHKFEIVDGRASYLNRYLRSETYKKNQKANRIVVNEYGTQAVPDPCHTIFDRISLRFDPNSLITDNSNISIYPYGDEVYALTDSSYMHRIDPVNLDTLDRKNLMSSVVVNHTSHPHVDTNGDVYNVGLSIIGFKVKHVIVRFPFKKKGEGDMFEQAEIVGSSCPRWTLHPSYMHSFGVTENYYVIVEQPFAFSLPRLMIHHLVNKTAEFFLKWHSGQDTHIVLISKKTGEEFKRYIAPTFFFVHVVNAFEQDGKLLLDVCSYKDASVIDGMYVQAIKNVHSNPNYAEWFRSRPKRFECPLDAPTNTRVQPQIINIKSCEMPRINYPLFSGKPYRYFYAISSDVDGEVPYGLLKVDTVTGDAVSWCEKDAYAGEPVFVPSPDAKSEDDGVLLSVLLFTKRSHALALIVLDARTMREQARAVFETPGEAPRCLHGWFFPA